MIFINNRLRSFLLFFSITICVINVNSQNNNSDAYKFSRVMNYVSSFYVDTVNTEQLTETAIIEMLKKLDPHSIYISKDEWQKMNEPLQGHFDGIGIQFNIMDDTLMVVSPITGGPSEKLGILAGDRIVMIDNENVAGIGITNQMVFDRLRGPKGTKVNVGIMRRGEKKILDFEITRDKIPIFSLDAAYMVDVKEKIAYIKLNRFSRTTMDEYKEALSKLQKEGAKHLILDLTNNGGGYLDKAFELADEFLSQGQMVVYTEGRNSPRDNYLSTSKGENDYGRVVIMIDEGSASASEIVSGAVQDWDRGVLVGRRSFGKGLVQRQMELPDGSAMRLTTAKYFTPTGRLIQKPYSKGVDEYHKDLVNRYNSGELTNEDSIHFPDSLKYRTLVNKRLVYGGGGIMPDIFVPIDTAGYTDYYRDLIRKGIINKFVLQYFDSERENLEAKYLSKNKDDEFGLFMKEFIITNEFLKQVTDFAEQEGVKFNENEFNTSKESLSVNLKANIARNLWNTSEFYEVFNTIDPIYLQAVEVIKNKDLYYSKLKPQ